MSILDRLKNTRQNDEDEDSQDDGEESDDEVVGKGGLWGRLGSLRGIGGNAVGMMGKALKGGVGGDDDDDSDDDDSDDDDSDYDQVTGGGVAVPVPAVIVGPSEESVAVSLAEEAPDNDDVIPLDGKALVTEAPEKAPKASGNFDMGGLFSENVEVDPVLRDLAMSQDSVSAQQLVDDLDELLGLLTSIA